MKSINSTFLIFSIVFIFVSCKPNADSYVGLWSKVKGSSGIVAIEIFEIKNDKVKVNLYEEKGGLLCGSNRTCTVNCKYDNDENKIYGSLLKSFIISFGENEDHLIMQWGDIKTIYKRKNE